jgi:hypothetical protein
MRKNKIQILLLIFITVFATGLFQTNLLEAAISSSNYDFGPVEVESTKTTAISITNLEDTSTTITGFVFAKLDCSDFSVVSMPESMTIPPNGTIHVEVGYKPLALGTCSDTLRIYAGSPAPYSVTLTGTGIEAISDQPEPFNISRPYLNQNDKKVIICHRPPGNPSKEKTLNISTESLDAHLAHGDILGACDDDQ